MASKKQESPPKPPRSAFICFSDSKKKEILERSDRLNTKDLLKLVAEDWRGLSPNERAFWDEEARNDKVRYVREKAAYKGPWNLPKRRAKKHPLAPKRPMSAFLKFSQQKRPSVKRENPDMANTDISALLGSYWRNASTAEKAPFVEEELLERAKYKEAIKKFRDGQAKVDAARRTSHRVAVQPQNSILEPSDSFLERFAMGSEGFATGSSVFRKAPIADSTNQHSRPAGRRMEHSRSKGDRSYAMLPPPPPPPPYPYHSHPRHHHHQHYAEFPPPRYMQPLYPPPPQPQFHHHGKRFVLWS